MSRSTNKIAVSTITLKGNKTIMSDLNLTAAQIKIAHDAFAALAAIFAPTVDVTEAPEAPAAKVSTRKAKATKAVAEPVEEETSEEDDDKAARKAELEAMTLAKLKKEAVELGFDAADLKDVPKEDIVQSILDDEFADEDGDDADDDDDDSESDDDDADDDDESDEDDSEDDDDDAEEEAEDDDLSYADADALSLKDLRAYVLSYDQDDLDEAGITKTSKKPALMEFLFPNGDEDEADDADEDEDDADDEEVEELTEEMLNEMSLAELKKVYVKYSSAKAAPAGVTKAKLIKLIVDLSTVDF